MKRTLNVSQAISLFFDLEEEEEEEEEEEDSSSSESESDDGVDDPLDDEQPGPSTETQSRRGRGRGRGRGGVDQSRSRSPQAQAVQPQPWQTAAEPDTAPHTSRFVPRRTPGAQVPGGEAVQRRVKGEDGHWAVKDIPCPTPIIAYNKNMGGVDLSDQLIQYYSTHRKTARWYRTLFMHFVDITTTNSYILHCDVSNTQQVQHMTHKNVMADLVSQLCGVEKTGLPINRSAHHVPVAITAATDVRKKATQGRRTCQHCHETHGRRNLTPWKCKACDVALCVVVDRNCFEGWYR
ncbi:hypothetical protein F7725_005145 [Dissostichus mawsoni]|uniref:PiggyBac transposable element-derived protein domain-containing protein n=1 Tax=Dissostichus mawsoni TaxID=36200 RepID=A0A7J5YQV9_DISMA|nr:hypothetical protein F7725_005145 [Dissostichus mawsoni]